MILLKYDTRHIRSFLRQDDFLNPLSFCDELLPIAPWLFASSSSLMLSQSLFDRLRSFADCFQNPPVLWQIKTKEPFLLICQGKEYRLPEGRGKYWENVFLNHSLTWTAACRFKISHPGAHDFRRFLDELNLNLPDSPILIELLSPFFLPVEFLTLDIFLAFLKVGTPASGILQTVQLLYDKNLFLAQEDAERTAFLIKKRNLISTLENPDILFVADHGNENGNLRNFVLEERLSVLKPKIVAVNSCAIGRGSFEEKIDGACILSAYDTEADKSLFAPLLRFLKTSDNRGLFLSFCLARIFYPNLAHFYRLYLPKVVDT